MTALTIPVPPPSPTIKFYHHHNLPQNRHRISLHSHPIQPRCLGTPRQVSPNSHDARQPGLGGPEIAVPKRQEKKIQEATNRPPSVPRLSFMHRDPSRQVPWSCRNEASTEIHEKK